MRGPIQSYFVPAQSFGALLFVSGQIPRRNGELLATGCLGDSVSLDIGRECARQCAQCILDLVNDSEGSLYSIEQIVKITVYIASTASFTEHPEVADAASDHLLAALGERGQHARAAVGVASLPRGVPVEVEAVIALRQDRGH